MLDNIKERPILFGAPMGRAILAGQKTQTRRVVKPQPETNGGEWFWNEISVKNKVGALGCFPNLDEFLIALRKFCPYGKPGERLWVRETFSYNLQNELVYRASADADLDSETKALVGWKPSIFMPRAASRVLLEIVSVRVERLKSISNSDAIAEGIEKEHSVIFGDSWKDYINPKSTVSAGAPTISFKTLWKSIHGPGPSSWKANPWVWVVEFKVIKPAAACPAGCVNALDCGNDGACQCAAVKGKEAASE